MLLLVNSSASSVTARARVMIQQALAVDHDVTLAETSRRGHATRLAQGAANVGVEVVVVLGGDGTLNEAANGLAGTDTALAALPGGSTNVFARTLGMANDPLAATEEVVAALRRAALGEGGIERVGLGSVDGRYFLFHVGLGFDAEVVRQVERRSTLKRYAGHPLFIYAGLTAWFRHYDRTRTRFVVHHDDGGAVEGRFAIVLNTNPYTYLGNRALDVAPDATLDRGLAALTLRSLTLGRFASVVASVLGTGERARGHRDTDYRSDVSGLRVVGCGPFPYQVDGDYLGEVDELTIGHEPGALLLVRPSSTVSPEGGRRPHPGRS